MNTVRKLARIETIDNILPAENADRLEVAVISGWRVVVQKNLYQTGDKVVFCEIDSMIPVEDSRFGISEDRAADVDGKKYLRITTQRFRGNLSQGIVFPARDFGLENEPDGTDVSELLGITKRVQNVKLGGNIIGSFPSFAAVRSDSERIQNLTDIYDKLRENKWVATEKLDGTSITVFRDSNSQLRVASRDVEVKAEGHPVIDLLGDLADTIPDNYAIQGELVGPGINGNKLQLTEAAFYVFQEFKNGEFVPRKDWTVIGKDMSVPVFDDYELPETAKS